MKRLKSHKIVPNLVMSAAAIVPAASAALIMVHASTPHTTELASGLSAISTTPEPSSSAVAMTTSARKHATAVPTAKASAAPAKLAASRSTRKPVSAAPTATTAPAPTPIPTAAPAPTAVPQLQSAPLQAQSANTNTTSSASGR